MNGTWAYFCLGWALKRQVQFRAKMSLDMSSQYYGESDGEPDSPVDRSGPPRGPPPPPPSESVVRVAEGVAAALGYSGLIQVRLPWMRGRVLPGLIVDISEMPPDQLNSASNVHIRDTPPDEERDEAVMARVAAACAADQAEQDAEFDRLFGLDPVTRLEAVPAESFRTGPSRPSTTTTASNRRSEAEFEAEIDRSFGEDPTPGLEAAAAESSRAESSRPSTTSNPRNRRSSSCGNAKKRVRLILNDR